MDDIACKLFFILTVTVLMEAIPQNSDFLVSAKNCPLPEVEHGIITIDGGLGIDGFIQGGKTVQLVCVPGYVVSSGSNSARCTHKGVFSKSLGQCTKRLQLGVTDEEEAIFHEHTCEAPDPPRHGSMVVFQPNWRKRAKKGHIAKTRFTAGTRVVFHCSSGFNISGSEENFCVDGSTWLKLFPKCVPVPPTTRPPEPIRQTVILPLPPIPGEPAITNLEIGLHVASLILVFITMLIFYFVVCLAERKNNCC